MLFIFDSKISIIISAFIMGFPWGGVFGIALLFIAQKSSNAQIAARLSALAQGFGYLIAAQGQWIIGFLHDKFENFFCYFDVSFCWNFSKYLWIFIL
ncbi:hypothetical protein F7512_05180 [Campylobacter jejuni]|nr:hypothetical protein [Campylobacter jejuni]